MFFVLFCFVLCVVCFVDFFFFNFFGFLCVCKNFEYFISLSIVHEKNLIALYHNQIPNFSFLHDDERKSEGFAMKNSWRKNDV